MDAFEVTELLARQSEQQRPYLEFLRVPSLSTGLYVLPADASDPQQPHTEDELYYVVSGRGMIRVADEDRAVEAGSMVYVPALVEHRFHTVQQDLVVLVFFAPAEYSNKG